MEKSNKRKAELEENVEGRVLLVENPDGVLHDLIKVLEDHSYEVFKCNGVDGLLSQLIKKNRIDIILTEGNQHDPMYVSQHLTQILLQTNLPVISISSNGNNINSHYHWLKGNIVRPILELVENLFYDRISKSGEVKRLNEEIKQVELADEEKRLKEEVEHEELPDEEKRLKEEVEHDELPDEEKLPEEKRLKGEVEHAEMPDEENKKKLEREKAGEHHQRMVWIGDVETMFVNIVTELDDKKGKATGKMVWKCLQTNGFKDISLKQVYSHLQKYRRKHKKDHPVEKSYQMLECKDQVDTSAGQDASRYGMEEHSSKTDAPMKTINGNLNTTSQEQHLNTEFLNNNIPGNFENGKGKDIFEDKSYTIEGFRRTDLAQALLSSPVPIEEATLLSTMEEGQPSNLHVNDIHGQAFDKNVSDLQSEEYKKLYIPAGITFEDLNLEDTDPQQHLNMDIDFSGPLDPDGMNPNTFENLNFEDTDLQQYFNKDNDFSEPLDLDGMNPNTFENFNFEDTDLQQYFNKDNDFSEPLDLDCMNPNS